MMYLTEECGRAVGVMISSTGLDAEVEITMESIVIRLKKVLQPKKEPKEHEPSVKEKKKVNKKAHLTKTEKKKRRWRTGEKVTFNGESLTLKEWAEKLGITESGVSYRIKAHGNPYGPNSPKPSDSDKVVAVS